MSSSSTSSSRRYDVFVSYRGMEVRDSLVSHLCDRLKREGLKCFYDTDPRDAGKKINKKIFSAICHAKVAVIMLSRNYAGSKWCLNELVDVLKCNMEPQNLVVIPAFYHVDPGDLTNLRNDSEFGRAFKGLCQKRENDQRRTTWEKALRDVKKFSGIQRKDFGDEAEFLNAVTCSLHENISPEWVSNFLKIEIEVDRLANDVIPLLKIGQEDGHMIGISGTEGIGKTTVAKAVCKATLDKFDRLIFLDKDGAVKDYNLVKGQMKLPQILTRQMLENSSHGYTEKIKNDLRHEKILLVLDGVTKKDQMKKFGVEDRHRYHHGSRILITTRDRNLLKDLKVDNEYIVEGLNRDEAFRLFCLHAFEEEEPKEGFEQLSRYLAHYAGGHPCALRKWGSILKNGKKVDWQKWSENLEKDPESFNSITPHFGEIFLEYPCRVVGPRGGGRTTQAWKDQGCTGVRKIEGGVDLEGIKFITVEYDNNGGSPNTVTLGTEGGQTRRFTMNYPEEYLTSISGHAREDSGRTTLQSLTFHINTGKRESIGTDEEGRKFSFPYTGHKIVGFHGSGNGSHLESIEAIYQRVPHTPIGYSGRVFGPFGGAGENSMHSNEINGISVSYAHFIRSITFEVDNGTSSIPQTYSRDGKKNTFEVKLENPYECITSFSGYFENARDGRILIKSLTFRTNKRILGPIGREEGKHFSSPSPSEAVKVTRFFWRTVDNYLESIGAEVGIGAEVDPYYPFKSVGLFGCSNASNWDDRHDDYINVRKIDVKFALDDVKAGGTGQTSTVKTFIKSITFFYEEKNKIPWQDKTHLGIPADDVEPCTIEIKEDEYLTSMSGYYTENGITSLTFGTTKGALLELIGCKEGIHFSSPVTGGKIVGFYGRSKENLKAIGAYFKPIRHLYPIKSVGPFGGSSGNTWRRRNIKGVGKIEMTHGRDIHCIKFVYKDGSDQSYSVRKSGRAPKTDKIEQIILDYPREYLTSISGYAQNGAIQSLTFHGNKGKHGPYGDEDGKYFWYPSNGSRITGFYGRQDPNSGTLISIGMYVEPIPRMCPFKTVGPFGRSGGTSWDDGVHTDVRGFRISHGEAIEAIGIAYDNNGSWVSGSNHGMGHVDDNSFVLGLKPGITKHPRGVKYEEVILDYPKERLCLIWVWEDHDGNTGQIHDLQIITTSRKLTYGPFIEESLQKKNNLTRHRIPSEEDDGKIVGFFGTAGRYLNSIGARLEPY